MTMIVIDVAATTIASAVSTFRRSPSATTEVAPNRMASNSVDGLNGSNLEISRATGIRKESSAVNRHCDRPASAMRFHQPVRRECQIQQLRIDIKFPIALVARRQHNIATHWSSQDCANLGTRDLDAISRAARALAPLDGSDWSTTLADYWRDHPGLSDVHPVLRDAVLEGHPTRDPLNWAEGLLTVRNPFFDNGMMFAGIEMAKQ